jgi:hypothetical protein
MSRRTPTVTDELSVFVPFDTVRLLKAGELDIAPARRSVQVHRPPVRGERPVTAVPSRCTWSRRTVKCGPRSRPPVTVTVGSPGECRDRKVGTHVDRAASGV